MILFRMFNKFIHNLQHSEKFKNIQTCYFIGACLKFVLHSVLLIFET